MIRIKVAVLINDNEILLRFINSLNGRFGEELELYAYSDVKKATEALVKYNINIFLVDKDIDFNIEDVPKMCTMVYLADSRTVNEINGIKAICIYQKPETIYSDLLGIFAENENDSVNNIGSKDAASNIYTFMSPVGGVGTSTISAAFAVYLAQNERKVLYVNFERNGDASAFFYGDGASDISDIFYDIKSKKQNLAIRIESKVKCDASGVYFAESSKNPLDLILLKAKDIEEFLVTVSSLKLYDDIVVDADCTMDDFTTMYMRVSTNTIIVNDGKDISNAKVCRFSAAIAALEIENGEAYVPKLCLFLNKFNSQKDSYDKSIKWSVLGGMDDYYGESSFQIIQRIVRSSIFDYFFYAKK